MHDTSAIHQPPCARLPHRFGTHGRHLSGRLTAEEHRAFAEAVWPVSDKCRKDYGESFFALLD